MRNKGQNQKINISRSDVKANLPSVDDDLIKKAKSLTWTYGNREMPLHIESLHGKHQCGKVKDVEAPSPVVVKKTTLKFGDIILNFHKSTSFINGLTSVEEEGALKDLCQKELELLDTLQEGDLTIHCSFVLGGTGFGKTQHVIQHMGDERWVYTAPSRAMCEQMAAKNTNLLPLTMQKAVFAECPTSPSTLVVDECFAMPIERLALYAAKYDRLVFVGDWARMEQTSKQLTVQENEGTAWGYDPSWEEHTHWCTKAVRFEKWYGDLICKEFYGYENWSGADSTEEGFRTVVDVVKCGSFAEAENYRKLHAPTGKFQAITFLREEADQNPEWKTQKECQGLTYDFTFVWNQYDYKANESACVAYTRHRRTMVILTPNPSSYRVFQTDVVPDSLSTDVRECQKMSVDAQLESLNKFESDSNKFEKDQAGSAAQFKYVYMAEQITKFFGKVPHYFEFTLDQGRLAARVAELNKGMGINGWNSIVRNQKVEVYKLPDAWTNHVTKGWPYRSKEHFEKETGCSKDTLFVVDAPLNIFKNAKNSKGPGQMTCISYNLLLKKLHSYYTSFNVVFKVQDHIEGTAVQRVYARDPKNQMELKILYPFGCTGNWFEKYFLIKKASDSVVIGYSRDLASPVSNYIQDMNSDVVNYDFDDLIKQATKDGVKSGEVWQLGTNFVVIPTTHPVYPFCSDRELDHHLKGRVNEKVTCVATFHCHDGHGAQLSDMDNRLNKLYYSAIHHIVEGGRVYPYYNGKLVTQKDRILLPAVPVHKISHPYICNDFEHPHVIKQLVSCGHLGKPNNVRLTGLPMSKAPQPIGESLINQPQEFVPLRYAPGEHNAYVACVSRFATNQPIVTRRALNAWWGLLVHLPEFVRGFRAVTKVGSTLDWIDRFNSNRARSFIRERYGTKERFEKARRKQLAKMGIAFDQVAFDKAADKIFGRYNRVFDKPDRPVNYKMMAKHDEYTVNNVTTKGPRAVCIPANWYLVALGPWTWAFGEMMKEVWNKDNDIVYTAGLSAEEIGQLLSEFELWYCGDFSGYDASLQWFHLAFQIMVVSMFMPREYVRRLVRRTIASRIRMPNFRYTGVGRTKSGHPGTSTFNTLLTAWIFFCACKLSGITRFKLLVSGDDTCLAINPRDFPVFERNLLRITRSTGLVLKGSIKHLYDLDYNSQFLYPTLDGWVLGPKIIRGSKRFVYSYDSPLDKVEHIQQLCLAESLNVSFIPILGDHLRELVATYGIAKKLGAWMDRRIRVRVVAKTHHVLDERLWQTVSSWRYGKIIESWNDKEIIMLQELEYSANPFVSAFGNDEGAYSAFSGPFL